MILPVSEIQVDLMKMSDLTPVSVWVLVLCQAPFLFLRGAGDFRGLRSFI